MKRLSIKFRMPKSARTWAKGTQWRELFMTIMATTISILLTFGTAGLLERCQRIEDRKMSAMMVMSNIEQFSRNVDDMSQKIARCDTIGTWLLSLPQDSLDRIPPKEVENLLNEMMALVNYLTHDKTAENIFSNSIETWKNMGNFHFIDNVGKSFSQMNADESDWNEWVNEYADAINSVIGQMQPGDHTLTKLLTDNVFRQKIEYFRARKAWLEYVAANIRYLNSQNMELIGINREEVMAFTDERSQSIHVNEEEPKQSDFRRNQLHIDSLTTLRPMIQHIDSIMKGLTKTE